MSAFAKTIVLLMSVSMLTTVQPTSAAGRTGQKRMTGTTSIKIDKTSFGKTADGSTVDLFTLQNKNGLKAKITTFGATLTELDVPGKDGKMANVVLGFDNIAQYESKENPYFGATVGRFANRIAGGKFTLDSKDYTLAQNNGNNTLHGGLVGFNKRVWHAEPSETADGPSVKFSYLSKDMEEGFPGNVQVSVTYTLTNDNAVKLEYAATTDKSTPINVTNHSYFNLAGAGSGDILGQELMLSADKYTPVNDELIPSGEIADVKGTPLDFTKLTTIGSRIGEVKGGYDHNFVLTPAPQALKLAARAVDPKSGRTLEMLTTEPGLQLYTSNFLDGTIRGNGGAYKKHAAFCLEAQHFPDSIHHANFPSAVLRPGQEYKQTTIYKFSAK